MNFKPEYYFLYTALSVSAAIVFSYLYYKKTNLTLSFKVFLISLRALSISLVLILFFISFITFSKKDTDKPVNIFLIDNSLSMNLEDRRVELNKSAEIINSLSNNISENKIFLFSSDIIREIETKELSGVVSDSGNNFSTNLAKTINSLSKKYGDRKISSINIFSDGIINDGGNPEQQAIQTGAAVNYFLIGDTIQKNDLSVKNVFFNNTVFTESNSHILVEFNSYNYEKAIRLNLYEDDILVQTKEIYVNREKNLYSHTFDIKSGTEGIKKYKAEPESLPDEITNKNNSEEFFINYISNKFKILVISGNPSPDFSYLTDELKSISNFDVKFFTQKSPGVFYEGQLPPMTEFNVLILLNFPNTSTDFNQLNKLSDDLKTIKLPVFFISGSNTDYEKLKILINYLPVSSINSRESEKTSRVKAVEDNNSDLYKYFTFGNSINNLPEINLPGVNFSVRTESKTILYSEKISVPVMVISDKAERSSAALFAYNFFKWRLNNSGSGSKNILGRIVNGTVLNIGNKDNDKKIIFNTDKQVYSPGEKIKIIGTISTADFSGNEEIKISIYNNNFNKEFSANKTSGSGFYGETEISEKGEYFVGCILMQNGSEIARDIKKILVKESGLEFRETKTDNGILNNLKNITGGIRINEQNSDDVKNSIRIKNEQDSEYSNKTVKIFLNSSIFLLLLLIAVLSTEWFFRKRLNLP